MEYEEFKNEMASKLACINMQLSESKIRSFYTYMEELIEWNKKINLTAIVEPNDIIDKHFSNDKSIYRRR